MALTIFNLFRPAINATNLEVEENKITFRTAAVAIGTIALVGRDILRNKLDPIWIYPIVLGATFAYAKIERVISKWLLDKIAVEKYISSQLTVENPVMVYLAQNKSALQKLLKTPGADLNKANASGYTLLDEAIFSTNFHSRREEDAFEICKILLERIPFRAFSFSRAIEGRFDKLAIYGLKNGKIKPADVTSHETAYFWYAVQDEKTAKMLLQKGFDINAKFQNGYTPLVQRLLDNHTAQIKLLLKFGAEIPDLKNFEGHLRRNPHLMEILEHARKARAKGVDLPDCQDYDSNVLQFNKPAVKVNKFSFSVDDATIVGRVCLVGIPILLGFTIGSVLNPILCPMMLPVLTLPIFLYKFEWKRATKKLNELAENEFRKNIFPSWQAMKYVSENFPLLQKVIDYESNCGIILKELWDLLLQSKNNLENFKLIANKVFHSENIDKFSFLKSAIGRWVPEYVEYILNINVIQLTDDQVFQCWMEVQDVKTAQVLKKFLSINVTNSEGLNPLEALFAKPPIYNFYGMAYTLIQAGVPVTDRVRASAQNCQNLFDRGWIPQLLQTSQR